MSKKKNKEKMELLSTPLTKIFSSLKEKKRKENIGWEERKKKDEEKREVKKKKRKKVRRIDSI